MARHVENRASSKSWVPSGTRCSYDAEFDIIMISYPKEVNACNGTIKFIVTFNTKNKATIMASSKNTDLVVIPVGVRCGEHGIRISPKAVYCKWFLMGYCALTPAGRIKVPSVIPSLDHHGMLANIKWRVLKSTVYLMACMGVMIICSGMTVKNVELLAATVRKMKAQTKDGHYRYWWCSNTDY
jgi:hypothetical protein